MITEKFMRLWAKGSSLFMVGFFLFYAVHGTYVYLTSPVATSELLKSINTLLLITIISNWFYSALVGIPLFYFGWFNKSKQSKWHIKMVSWSKFAVILVLVVYTWSFISGLINGVGFFVGLPYLLLAIMVIYPLSYYAWGISKEKGKSNREEIFRKVGSSLWFISIIFFLYIVIFGLPVQDIGEIHKQLLEEDGYEVLYFGLIGLDGETAHVKMKSLGERDTQIWDGLIGLGLAYETASEYSIRILEEDRECWYNVEGGDYRSYTNAPSGELTFEDEKLIHDEESAEKSRLYQLVIDQIEEGYCS